MTPPKLDALFRGEVQGTDSVDTARPEGERHSDCDFRLRLLIKMIAKRPRDVRRYYGPSFADKVLRRSIPLWVLFVAVQLLDVFWLIVVLIGIEKVRYRSWNQTDEPTRSLTV
jgi:hypothetical protein